jgi:N-acetylglucosamine-6-sulfatase
LPRRAWVARLEALRAQGWLYVEYADGEREYHDRLADPHELRNIYSSLSAAQRTALHATLEPVRNCHDATSCRAAQRSGGVAAQR